MEQTNYVIYGDDYEFKDMIICAFRYAIYRHTYTVEEVTSWIKNNSHILDGDKRVYGVLLSDLNERIEQYEQHDMYTFERIDYDTLVSFKEWLLDFGKGYGWNEE